MVCPNNCHITLRGELDPKKVKGGSRGWLRKGAHRPEEKLEHNSNAAWIVGLEELPENQSKF